MLDSKPTRQWTNPCAFTTSWLFVAAVSAWGAEPLSTTITYQGRLNLNGIPVNDTCDFEFSLWDGPSSVSSSQVGPTLAFDGMSGNAPPITIVDGLFAAALDFGSGAFIGEARWLETAVSCPAGGGTLTALSPRQPIAAAPYALYALTCADSGSSPQQSISGTWLLDGGGMLPTFVEGLATFGVTADVTAITLNPDGSTGRVFLRDRLTGARDCLRTFALFNGETLVLDFSAEKTTDFQFNIAVSDTMFIFPVVTVQSDMLGLADEAGQIAILSRQTALPAEASCGALQVVDRFEDLPAPQFFTDLVLFNGDLVYSTSSNIEAFDPSTNMLGTPLGTTSSRLVQTSQGGFLWTHCGCGGSRDAFKRTLLILADTVSSEDEMGGPITFRAMAYGSIADRLWLHGRSFDDQFGRFYVMNTNGEPDTIERQISFNRDLRGLAFDGPDLWGIITVASQSIVRIDTATGAVLDSYEVPDEDVSWAGIVFDQFYMYLLGTNLDGQGVLYRVVRPPPSG